MINLKGVILLLNVHEGSLAHPIFERVSDEPCENSFELIYLMQPVRRPSIMILHPIADMLHKPITSIPESVGVLNDFLVVAVGLMFANPANDFFCLLFYTDLHLFDVFLHCSLDCR